jgi:16S rRNA (uracil1498-N3)-methyltransferase
MARLHCPKEFIGEEQIIINQPRQVHYLRDVLRLRFGDDVSVFDGEGHEYHCCIQGVSKTRLTLMIKGKSDIELRQKIYLAIACALPKQRNRFDDLVNKLSQLGVNKIIPMITERVIVRWGPEQKQRYQQRWAKIAEAACIQSGRDSLPAIEPIREISQVLTEDYDLKLIAALTDNRQTLKGVLSKPLPKSILVLIGPEGDFSKQELTRAKKTGFIPLDLGSLVLRVDTAAIAVAAFFRLSEATPP